MNEAQTRFNKIDPKLRDAGGTERLYCAWTTHGFW